MTKKEAKELSILKWEYIVNNNGKDKGVMKKYPELFELMAECPYCELYQGTQNKTYHCCAKCPIKIKKEDYNDELNTSCMQKVHPWNIWLKKPSKQNAQAILDLIIKS